jgi:hypothetical protein
LGIITIQTASICHVIIAGGEIHYGTLKDAKESLKYVKNKEPNQDWKIFMLVELPEKS